MLNILLKLIDFLELACSCPQNKQYTVYNSFVMSIIAMVLSMLYLGIITSSIKLQTFTVEQNVKRSEPIYNNDKFK